MYRSARDILTELPAVFTLSEFQMVHDFKRTKAITYLHRYVQQGHVARTGPRSGVFLNLIVDPEASFRRQEESVAKVFPSAVMGSLSILHDEGVVTQIPARLHVMILQRRTYPKFDSAVFHPRPAAWYALMADQKQIVMPPTVPLGAPKPLPRMTPEAALVDALAYGDGWVSSVEDIDIGDLDHDQLTDIGQAMGLSPSGWDILEQAGLSGELLRLESITPD